MRNLKDYKKSRIFLAIFLMLIVLGFIGSFSSDSADKNTDNRLDKDTINNKITEKIIEEKNKAETENVTDKKLEDTTEGTKDVAAGNLEVNNKNDGNSDNLLSGTSNSLVQVKELTRGEITEKLENIPLYEGSPYVVINDNVPFFLETDNTLTPFEYYSEMDNLSRCGVAFANICVELMPTEERGKIGSIKPSAWHSVKYENVDGNYLYNRCHLIGFQLAGENANEKNLITGTRYLNVEGMLPFENMVADYVKETNNHVLYRVTPIFEGSNLLASGVLVEAKSVEDNGAGILFNVYCFNAQPGITIDYATGDSWLNEPQTEPPTPAQTEPTTEPQTQPPTEAQTSPNVVNPVVSTYMVNTNTGKFHTMSCSSIKQMSDKNKWEFSGTRDELIAKGYEPCQRCNP